MIFPPIFLIIGVREKRQNFRLFLPLPMFLLFPLVLLLNLLLIPIALMLTLIYWHKGWGFTPIKLLWYVFEMYCSIRKLKVDVSSQSQNVTISIF